MSINSITSDEICVMEFGIVDESYEFYYLYGKCKIFSIRKMMLGQEGPKVVK